MEYSKEQIQRANAVDIVDYLKSRGESVIKSGKEFRWKQHDSVTIDHNQWFRHSEGQGGNPIDFLMKFYNMTFPEAMEELIREKGDEKRSPSIDEKDVGSSGDCPIPSSELKLPELNESNDKAKEYLTKVRGLKESLVDHFIEKGMIAEEKAHRNILFFGKDTEGKIRYAHRRGMQINETKEDRFRMDVSGSDKSYGFSYQGSRPHLFVFESPIDMMSFIQLFPTSWKERNYVSLGGVTDAALTAFLSARPDINVIYLCLDSDEAGRNACVKIADSLSDRYIVKQIVPQKKDWNEVITSNESKLIAERNTLKDSYSRNKVPMIYYKDIEATEVEWLWYPYIPFGKVTILQGNPGEGKTYFSMQLCAACTNHKELPNMEEIEPFNVIYQTAEDGMADTIKPRLIEAGADMDRVMVIDDTEDPLTLSDERIEKAIIQNNVRLMIIDPLQAFIGADVDMNRANEVRPVFRRLGQIADATGCAIVLIGHLNKSTGTSSTYRGLGSIDITAAVRSILFIGKVRKDPTTRVLLHEKSSLAPPGETLAFHLGDDQGFRWIGAYEITADELLNGSEGIKTMTKKEKGIQLIKDMLKDGQEISLHDLEEQAKEKGISARTMRNVRKEMEEQIETRTNYKNEAFIKLKANK